MTANNKKRFVAMFRRQCIEAAGTARLIGLDDVASYLAFVAMDDLTADHTALKYAQKINPAREKSLHSAPGNGKITTKAARREGPKMKYTEDITSSRWVDGSGWAYQDCYAGFETQEFDEREINMDFSASDFAYLITDSYYDNDERTLEYFASGDRETDELYTYTLTDENGEEVKRIEIWFSAAAKYRLGYIDEMPEVQ